MEGNGDGGVGNSAVVVSDVASVVGFGSGSGVGVGCHPVGGVASASAAVLLEDVMDLLVEQVGVGGGFYIPRDEWELLEVVAYFEKYVRVAEAGAVYVGSSGMLGFRGVWAGKFEGGWVVVDGANGEVDVGLVGSDVAVEKSSWCGNVVNPVSDFGVRVCPGGP
jgi:hypothetical protein